MAADLKISNRRTVYSLLRQEGEMSKAEIMRRTGISTPTVLKITDYFMSLGILAEAGEGAASIGRKPTLLRIQPDAIYTIGAVFDGRGLSLGLVDLFGAPRGLRRTAAPASLQRLLEEDLPAQALRLIEDGRVPLTKVKGIGIGVPGVVDPSGTTVRFAPLAGIQQDFDASVLLQSLERRLGMPVQLENDANAAALGEHSARSRAARSRAAERPDADGSVRAGDFIFVELGRGLGAGIILDGKLRKGSRAMAGEIGYLVLDPSWKATSDAPGWLEGRLDLDEFWAEVDGHKTPSKRSLRRVISYLALGLSNISLALDLDLIVVGRAGLEHFGGDFLNSLKAELARFSVLETSCVPSMLEEPGVSGAAGLVAEAWLEGVYSE